MRSPARVHQVECLTSCVLVYLLLENVWHSPPVYPFATTTLSLVTDFTTYPALMTFLCQRDGLLPKALRQHNTPSSIPTCKNDEPVNVGCEAFYIIRFNITAVNGHTDPYHALQLGGYTAEAILAPLRYRTLHGTQCTGYVGIWYLNILNYTSA